MREQRIHPDMMDIFEEYEAYTLEFQVLNTEYGHLGGGGVDKLYQMAILSDIAFKHNTYQVARGDSQDGMWLEVHAGNWRVMRDVLHKARAAGIEEMIVNGFVWEGEERNEA